MLTFSRTLLHAAGFPSEHAEEIKVQKMAGRRHQQHKYWLRNTAAAWYFPDTYKKYRLCYKLNNGKACEQNANLNRLISNPRHSA
jgi:hypothetical protein